MSRIYQYPVVTEISNDDYLALGSAVNGSRSILASDLAPVIGNKTITERGTYEASDDDMDGYGQVTVDIPYTDIHVASGDIVTFEGEDLPLKSLKVAVTPYQDLSHGDPSPENICPIIGWDEAVVSVSGINVWDEEWELGQYDASGNPYPNNDCIRTKNFISVKPNTTYYQTTSGGIMQALYYDINKGFINSAWMGSNTFTTPSNCYYIHFRLGSTYGTTYNNDISINYPSTDTLYHAYNGATYTIDLNGTRYGGELDVLNGVDTDNLGSVDLGTLNYSTSSDTPGLFYSLIPNMKNPTTVLERKEGIISSMYPVSNSISISNSMDDKSMLKADGHIFIRNTDYTSASDFKQAMSGVQLVYELATPITVQLAPTQVKSLVGENNIFANCGAVDVEYQTVWVRPSN